MNFRSVLSLILAAALGLSLTGCGPSQEEPAGSSADASSSAETDAPHSDAVSTPFTLAVFPDASLHPVLSTSKANLTLAPLLYEPLFQLDGQFNAVPVLCESWTFSPDKLVWNFDLREGVTLSDDSVLTGKAVAAALDLARGEGSRFAQRLRDVVSVTGSGRRVTITLSRPNGRLPQLLDIPIAVGTGSRPAGSGPYALTQAGDEFSLTARSDWWQHKQLPQQSFPLDPIHETDELIYAFDTGDVSLVELDMLDPGSAVFSEGSRSVDYATTDLIYLGFNTQRGLCKEPKFRTAVSRAIDRKSVVQTNFANHAAVSPLPVHPDSPLYNSTAAAALSYEPLALSRLMEELSPGRPLTFLVNSESEAKASTAQLIANQLETAGLSVNLRKLPFEEYTAALAAGNFDLYLGEVILTADFDLTALLAPGGSVNYSGWANPQAPALVAALAAADADAAPEAAKALFDLLVQDPPVAAVCFTNGSVLSQWGRLDRISPVRGNVFYQLENWIIQ